MKNIVTKLAKVMTEVKYIQKRGRNTFHNYNYATEADVNEKVREVLAGLNVIMLPNMISHNVMETTTAKGAIEYIVTVDMEFTFFDGDSGESITYKMAGAGQDRGDKGIFKAISGAQKYALMKVFMIPTGDDPEADEPGDEQRQAAANTKPSKQQQKTPSGKDVAKELYGGKSRDDAKAEWVKKMKDLGDYASSLGVDPPTLRSLSTKNITEWTYEDMDEIRQKLTEQFTKAS